jgi:hypothetical protein
MEAQASSFPRPTGSKSIQIILMNHERKFIGSSMTTTGRTIGLGYVTLVTSSGGKENRFWLRNISQATSKLMPLKHVNVYLPFLLLSSKLFPDISFEML